MGNGVSQGSPSVSPYCGHCTCACILPSIQSVRPAHWERRGTDRQVVWLSPFTMISSRLEKGESVLKWESKQKVRDWAGNDRLEGQRKTREQVRWWEQREREWGQCSAGQCGVVVGKDDDSLEFARSLARSDGRESERRRSGDRPGGTRPQHSFKRGVRGTRTISVREAS